MGEHDGRERHEKPEGDEHGEEGGEGVAVLHGLGISYGIGEVKFIFHLTSVWDTSMKPDP